MSMCRVISCIVLRRCLLWPVCCLGKILVAFCPVSFIQGQTCLLLYVSLGFLLLHSNPLCWDFPVSLDSKESTCNTGDLGSIPGLGRFSGGGHGNPLQYSCLENPHGQRSLVSYSPGVTESDMTEQLSTAPMMQRTSFFGINSRRSCGSS